MPRSIIVKTFYCIELTLIQHRRNYQCSNLVNNMAGTEFDPSRQRLRSSLSYDLMVPRTIRSTIGERSIHQQLHPRGMLCLVLSVLPHQCYSSEVDSGQNYSCIHTSNLTEFVSMSLRLNIFVPWLRECQGYGMLKNVTAFWVEVVTHSKTKFYLTRQLNENSKDTHLRIKRKQ